MITITDIYFKVDSRIVEQNFWAMDIDGKKQLIDQALKQYILSKICELSGTSICNTSQDMTVIDLFKMLAQFIEKKQHFDTIRHFVHYILQVAGTLQGWSITWYQEQDEVLIEEPLIEFDERNLWTELKTHEKTDYVTIFTAVYFIFQNYFMCKEKTKALETFSEK